jgi:hypothetical protein
MVGLYREAVFAIPVMGRQCMLKISPLWAIALRRQREGISTEGDLITI